MSDSKLVKVPSDWSEEEIIDLKLLMEEKGFDGIIVAESELEVYDSDLKEVTIEGEEVFDGE